MGSPLKFQSLLFWNLSMNIDFAVYLLIPYYVSILIVLEFINERVCNTEYFMPVHTVSILIVLEFINELIAESKSLSCFVVSILIVLEFINELVKELSEITFRSLFQSLLFWNLSMNIEFV